MLDSVSSVLPGKLTFQLHRYHRDAVEEQNNVNAVFVIQRIMQLPGTMENIGSILGLASLVDGGLRFPEHSSKLDSPVGKALAQHSQQAYHLHFPTKTVDELSLTVGTVYLFKPLPLLRLACPNEGKKRADVQRFFPVEDGGVALLVAAVCSEVFLNILLKTSFPYIEIRHSQIPHFGSICITALPNKPTISP